MAAQTIWAAPWVEYPPALVTVPCRSAFSSMPSPPHGTASTAPVVELRRNSTLLAPDSSLALRTVGSAEVPSRTATLVPAVT